MWLCHCRAALAFGLSPAGQEATSHCVLASTAFKICYVKTQCTSDGRAVLTRPPGKWWELLSFMSTSPCSTFKVGNQIYLCSLDMSGSKICEKTVPNQSKNQWSDATCSLVLLKTAYWEARITYLAKWDPFGWALAVWSLDTSAVDLVGVWTDALDGWEVGWFKLASSWMWLLYIYICCVRGKIFRQCLALVCVEYSAPSHFFRSTHTRAP